MITILHKVIWVIEAQMTA
jgi:hypothetical protein